MCAHVCMGLGMCAHEQLSEWVCTCVSDWVIESGSQGVSEWVSEWMSEPVPEWLSDEVQRQMGLLTSCPVDLQASCDLWVTECERLVYGETVRFVIRVCRQELCFLQLGYKAGTVVTRSCLANVRYEVAYSRYCWIVLIQIAATAVKGTGLMYLVWFVSFFAVTRGACQQWDTLCC